MIVLYTTWIVWAMGRTPCERARDGQRQAMHPAGTLGHEYDLAVLVGPSAPGS